MSRAKLRTFTLRICKHPVDRSPEFVNTSEVAYRGQTLLHIHEVFVLGDVVFVVNGGLVERLDWDSTVVRPRDIVDAVPNVGWIWAALTWAFWSVAVPLIISYGLSYLGGELFGADAEESEDRFEGVNHAWNPRTTQREGLVRPRAYGESMQHGNITASWTDTEDDNEILYAIIDHGEGPVEGLGSNILYIDDQPAGNYSGVTVIERNGTIPQTVMPGFEKTKIEYTLNWELTSAIGEKVFTTPNMFFDDLEYTIAFPGGLVEIDEEDGDSDSYGVTVDVQISERGLNSWTVIQHESISRATRDAVFINHKLSELPSGCTFSCERGKQYDLKFRRITGPGGSNVLSDSYVKSVREVVDTAFTHPGRSMLGVTALATGQLHGTSPDFKCIRKGRIVAVYNGTSWSLEYSPLTAWVVYDAVTQPIITGTGESGDPFVIARYDGVHPDNLDTAFFYEWAQLCDYQVDDGKDGTESQFTCNFNLDTERSVFSLAYELAQVARATLYWEGNILTGWLDDDVTTIEDLITVDNVVAKSWKNSWGGKTDRAGSSTVFYRDGENGFERTSIKVSNAQAGSYKSAISVEASGETRRSGAIRYGHFLMEKNARIKNMNTFDVLKDAMRWKLGEVVRVQCMTAGWGEGYRILSTESDGRTLVLDRPIENVQADDTIYIRTYDEVELEVNNSSYTVYCVDGSTITVTTDLDPLPGRHNILAATTSTTARTSTPVLRRIVGLKQRSDGFYAVTVQTYDAALYGASPPVENPNTSPVWAAPAKSQGLEPRPINYTSLITAIKNSVPILGGSLSITWKGEFASPPADPITNWVYRNTTDDIVYIYDGDSWEEMVYDGDDGAAGATGDTGDNGLSVFITYHDNEADNAPSTPTGDGTTGGWHTAVTNDVVWFSQKIATGASAGTWGTPLRISGTAIWSEVIDDGAKPDDDADVTPGFPSDTDLLGHWSFDNGSAKDNSGNSDDGTISGATAVTSAIVGGGLSFDGTDDYVGDLNISLPPTASSISWWMIKDSDTSAGIFVRYEDTSHSRIDYVAGNHIRVEAAPNLTWDVTFDAGIDVDDGKWHHYVVVYDTAACRLYVDGALADSDTANSSGSATEFAFMGENPGGYANLDGDLSEVRTYNKSLSAGEVKALFLWPRGSGKIQLAAEDVAVSAPTEIPWVLNCQWSQESNGTIHWDSRDGVNSIQLAYQGEIYDIVEGSTTDEFVYWDKAYTTVFSHNSSISVALAAENWLLCGVVSGIAYPTTPLQFVHAGVLLAGTIRAESYAELRQTMPWTGQDSCDAAYPYTFDFKIPSELEALISIKLSFKIREYRAYATGAAAGGQQTSGDGGSGVFDTTGAANWPIGADPTTKSSGEGDGATGSDSADYTGYENLGSHTHAMPSHSHDISGDTENADGTGSHDHDLSSFNVDCSSEDPGDTYAKDLSTHRHTAVDHTHSTPAHSHSMAKSELAHDHGLTLTDHTHSVADHQHDITYGIHEESGSPTVNVHIDNGAGFGASIGAYGASQTDIDILAHFSGAGWKSIRFNPDVRCRVSVILEVKLDITA